MAPSICIDMVAESVALRTGPRSTKVVDAAVGDVLCDM